MSEDLGLGPVNTPPEDGGSGPRRPASVSLRTPGGPRVDQADLMDPANQSLADALRITFWVLQLSMVVLAALFALSGFQSIQEGERGISLLFGRVVGRDLRPGFHFSFPRPMGEMIRIQTGAARQTLDTDFWPHLSESQRRQSIEQLTSRPSLNPATDGSLITADEALAHARWSVVYVRTDPEKYAQNVLPEHEEQIVRAAVRRGVVQAVAQTRIDDLLKQSSGDEGSVALRARQIAQRTLDDMGAGITVEQLQLVEKMPPLRLRSAFASVQTAESTASQARQEALGARDRAINETAGAAAPLLIAQIARYEEAIELGDEEAQRTIHAAIDALLEGRDIEGGPADKVSGEVTRILGEARQYRSSVESRARADFSRFEAKLEQFETNPLVMVARDWNEAFRDFADRPNVQQVVLPRGTSIYEMILNLDPDILREQQRQEAEARGRKAQEARGRLAEEERHRTDTRTQRLRAD